MSGKIGQVERGELWLRCPFCGDSPNNLFKAHFSINITTGFYHCFRCKAKGRLSTKQFLELGIFGGEFNLEEFDQGEVQIPLLFPGPASSRRSGLGRYHLTHDGEDWDAFYTYEMGEEDPIGVVLRRPGKSRVIGEVGIAWPGAPKTFPTKPSSPIRIVEGPYDVLTPYDLCCFGLISEAVLERVKRHYLLLCPDGDVWQKKDLLKSWMRTLDYAFNRGLMLVGVEYIPDGKDPDETPIMKREVLSRGQVYHLLREYYGRRHTK